LWIGDVAYFKLSEEELRRLVEEARRMAPDLSGIRKIWQTLEWFATDMSFTGGQIEGEHCLSLAVEVVLRPLRRWEGMRRQVQRH
jgi:hypothetical protein